MILHFKETNKNKAKDKIKFNFDNIKKRKIFFFLLKCFHFKNKTKRTIFWGYRKKRSIRSKKDQNVDIPTHNALSTMSRYQNYGFCKAYTTTGWLDTLGTQIITLERIFFLIVLCTVYDAMSQGGQRSISDVTCSLAADLDLSSVSGQIGRHLLHFSRSSSCSLAVSGPSQGSFQLLVNNLR